VNATGRDTQTGGRGGLLNFFTDESRMGWNLVILPLVERKGVGGGRTKGVRGTSTVYITGKQEALGWTKKRHRLTAQPEREGYLLQIIGGRKNSSKRKGSVEKKRNTENQIHESIQEKKQGVDEEGEGGKGAAGESLGRCLAEKNHRYSERLIE